MREVYETPGVGHDIRRHDLYDIQLMNTYHTSLGVQASYFYPSMAEASSISMGRRIPTSVARQGIQGLYWLSLKRVELKFMLLYADQQLRPLSS